MATEKQKMLAGELYVATGEDLAADARRAAEWMDRYNASLARTQRDHAAMLREFGRRMDFVPWQPPQHELFAFRALTREVQALSKVVAAAKNRLHAITATQLAPAALRRALERQIAQNQALVDELVAAALALSETHRELADFLGACLCARRLIFRSAYSVLRS